MSKSLQERLQRHSNSLSGLLSLIPAKYYYDDATKDQWQRKKLTKQQIKEQKLKKFDPESAVTAEQVRQQRELAAQKQTEDDDSDDVIAYDDEGNELNFSGLVSSDGEDTVELQNESSEDINEESFDESTTLDADKNKGNDNSSSEPVDEDGVKDFKGVSKSLKATANGTTISKAESAKQNESALKLNEKSREKLDDLRGKLAEKIAQLKKDRKAPGTGGVAPVTRQAMIESRKLRKEELQKKKELKRKREEEVGEEADVEPELQDEVITGDGSSGVFTKLAFKDGSKTSSDLTGIMESRKKKGPSDLLGQLRHLQAKKAKISSLDESKKSEIAERHQWNRLLAKSEGEKVRDDEKLLKKSLRQQQKKKKKSEKEWKERKDNVAKGIRARQQRREENLQHRRDMKGVKGKKRTRAGFEGKKRGKKRG